MAEVNVPRVAIVGGESLLGRDIIELLSAIKPEPATILVSGEASSAQLTRDDQGEAMVLTPISPEALADVRAVILAGTAASSLRALELTAERRTTLIDLAGALEDQPNARLRSPILEPTEERGEQNIHVIAHPAATALAMFYSRLAGHWNVQRSVIEVFEPASERGQPGLHELQSQTVNLLSFKPLPQDVYDVQVGFNLLPAFGSEAPQSLEQSELRIERHLATLLLISSRPPMPSLRLIQAPVFHGYSASIWVEFDSDPTVVELQRALATAQIEVRMEDEQPPSNAGVAGQSGMTVGDIRRDRNNSRAFWFWLVTDNIRTFAETAVAVLKEQL